MTHQVRGFLASLLIALASPLAWAEDRSLSILAAANEGARRIPLVEPVGASRPVLAGAALGGALGAGLGLALTGDDEASAPVALVFAAIGGAGGALGGALTSPRRSTYLETGDFVRHRSDVAVVGRIRRIEDAGVVVTTQSGVERLIRLDGRAIEVRRSTRLTKAGAFGGAFLGASIGTIVVALCEGECGSTGGLWIPAFGVGGAVAGGLVGALIQKNDWKRVTPTADERGSERNPRSRLSFAVAPTRDRGVRGAVRWTWR
jgi:hypothetical protein